MNVNLPIEWNSVPNFYYFAMLIYIYYMDFLALVGGKKSKILLVFIHCTSVHMITQKNLFIHMGNGAFNFAGWLPA